MWTRSTLRIAALLAVVFAPARGGANTPDLDRVVPVAAGQPIPVQDFFRPPLFSKPVLNPTGTLFAAQGDVGRDQVALLLGDVRRQSLQTVNFSKDEDVAWLAWLDDTRILTSLVGEKRFPRGLHVTDTTTRRTYPLARYNAASLVGVPVKEPMLPLVWIYRNAYDDGKNLGVIQLDARKRLGEYSHPIPGSFQDSVAHDEAKLHGTRAPAVASFPNPPGGALVVNYLADQDGGLGFALTFNRGQHTLFRFTGNDWKESPVNFDLYYPIGAGDRPGELIVLGPAQNNRPRGLHRLDAISGALGEPLLEDPAYDLTTVTLQRDPVTRRILGLKYQRSGPHTAWLDAGYAAVQKQLEERFPGQVVDLLGSNRAGDGFFFSAASDRQPPIYYSYNPRTDAVGLVCASAPWIDSARMQPTRVLRIGTRDGFDLEGYLTLPAGATRDQPPPVVVLAHGGPHARDVWGFNGEVQFLASRGYAVLQVNYRGSTGYNWMFPPADLWDFQKMHRDVTDAAHMLAKSGLVDANRMAIMGTSFGGYLALCGAAFETGRYRCAIAIAGVFDWAQAIEQMKSVEHENPAYSVFVRALGDPRANPARFDAISPLRHLEQVRIPVFVAHGRDDTVADFRGSRDLIAGLAKNAIPHESLIVAREGHGMSYTKNQVELYSRIEAFLARYLAPAK